MIYIRFITLTCLVVVAFSCKEEVIKSDAYGNFETTKVVVSSESTGKLIKFDAEEGQQLSIGMLIAIVDTVSLDLQRKLLMSQIGTISTKTTDPSPEIEVYKQQKANVVRERDRLKKLVAAKAATAKQLDDVEGQIVLIDQQIQAAKDKSKTANRGILSERNPINAQIDVINEKISKSYVYNPITGTVINKLAEPSEVVGFGSPLYTIADLSTMTLRAYTDALRMQNLKINDEVTVKVDVGSDGMRSIKGKVTWISSNAEFTPKIIQTKEERINLVYAIKIEVANDGRLKIGMPAEVDFGQVQQSTE